MKKRCYISGPITGTEDYLKRFAEYEKRLKTVMSCTFMNPAKILFEMPEDTTCTEYMDMCETMLKMCDRIFLMSGWEHSKGARFEREYALMHGLTIYEEDENGAITMIPGKEGI